MATRRQQLDVRLPFKPLLKFILLIVVGMFILYKLLGNFAVDKSEIAPHKSNLNENNALFSQQEKPNSDQTYLHNHHDHGDHNDGDVHTKEHIQKVNSIWHWSDSLLKASDAVFVMIPFSKARHNMNLQTKFQICVTSMSELSSAPIVLFIAGDEESREIADDIVSRLPKKNVDVHHLNVDELGEMMKDTIQTMQQHFSYKPGAYYSHTLFFLSTALHRLAPPTLHRLIMLDADLKFKDDIRRLHELFDRFLPSNVIGIAHENQPVYRHVLATYRQSHPGTRVGEPPPGGLPGFNSGVLLLDLDRMRKSDLYNSMLKSGVMKTLSEKYLYKGHLGDQDFYTLVSLENEDLFFVLPCGWNRQLCQWWRDNGYKDVFDQYFTCPGRISVYHSNCNTPVPNE